MRVRAVKELTPEAARRQRAEGDPYSVSTVERAFDLLAAFSPRHPELSLTDIATRTGLHKATAFRLLSALSNRDVVLKNPRTGTYRLGYGLIALAETAKTSTDFVSHARPFMRQIRDELNETVYIAVRIGDNRINLEQLEGLRDIRRVVAIGKSNPLYVGSTSLVMLAALADDEITSYLDRTEIVPPFPGAKVDLPTIWREVRNVRRNGYGETHNKRLDEGASVSAAVYGAGDGLLGAITISVPISRYTEEARAHIIQAVTSAAHSLSRELGARDGFYDAQRLPVRSASVRIPTKNAR
jgi:DNA-binding IclR family transcriptional regulator